LLSLLSLGFLACSFLGSSSLDSFATDSLFLGFPLPFSILLGSFLFGYALFLGCVLVA
jgi:hypothetical protein